MRDRLLTEHVLARIQCGRVEREVLAVPGDHVDDVDVVTLEQLAVVGGGNLGAELGRSRNCPVRVKIADANDLAPVVPGPAGQMCKVRPPAGADYADAESLGCHVTRPSSISSSRRQRAACSCSPAATSAVSQVRQS